MAEYDCAQGPLPQHFEINLEYADDIAATTNHAEIENLKQ